MSEKGTRLLFAIVSLVSLALYLVTLLPEVEWGDSAELALQAYQLGVTHPTGYPVHSLLAKFVSLIAGDPTLGSNLLSAICTSVSVGLLFLIALRSTGNAYAAAAAALMLAVSPFIWERAVVTEIYNVNLVFVALTLFLALRWHEKLSAAGDGPVARLYAIAAVYGLSLGTYMANLLLLPGLLVLVLRHSRKKLGTAARFLLIVALLGCLVLSWNSLRSRVIPPVGTSFVPDTAANLVRYLTGVQYDTTSIQGPSFYARRLAEHAITFARNFFGLGIVLGLVGLWNQWRASRADAGQRTVCIALLLMFVVDMAYFTSYAVWDYAYMVTPSYFVFALWIAQGIAYLGEIGATGQHGARLRIGLVTRVATAVASVAVVLGLLVWQLPARLERSRATPLTDFVAWSSEVLPDDAVVIGSWSKFTALLYHQTAYDVREDLTIVERINETRHYSHGSFANWRAYVDSLPPGTAVFIDRLTGPEAEGIRIQRTLDGWPSSTARGGPSPPSFSWHQIQLDRM